MEMVGVDADADNDEGRDEQPAASEDAAAPAEERSEQQAPQPPTKPATASSGWRVTCSMVEVYNDEIRDLLAKETGSGSGSSTLEIRRDAEGGLVVRACVRTSVRGMGRRDWSTDG